MTVSCGAAGVYTRILFLLLTSDKLLLIHQAQVLLLISPGLTPMAIVFICSSGARESKRASDGFMQPGTLGLAVTGSLPILSFCRSRLHYAVMRMFQ
ncbi:hypothetical protein VULLAG_LOCUS4051 [Vulpes lagopus]